MQLLNASSECIFSVQGRIAKVRQTHKRDGAGSCQITTTHASLQIKPPESTRWRCRPPRHARMPLLVCGLHAPLALGQITSGAKFATTLVCQLELAERSSPAPPNALRTFLQRSHTVKSETKRETGSSRASLGKHSVLKAPYVMTFNVNVCSWRVRWCKGSVRLTRAVVLLVSFSVHIVSI